MITVFIVGMIVFFGGAILDFFYDIIIAPSIRMSLTLQLDELRREAIALKAECIDPGPYLDCLILQESIEFMIRKLRRISVSSLDLYRIGIEEIPGVPDKSTGARADVG